VSVFGIADDAVYIVKVDVCLASGWASTEDKIPAYTTSSGAFHYLAGFVEFIPFDNTEKRLVLAIVSIDS
jgi:hypothetical protein